MTIGEKIQYYRKQNGLSQEELGQRLLVSRQTVSLWETGQTLPTIDNLIRLKEIFGVTIDHILCESDAPVDTGNAVEGKDIPTESPGESPAERYTFRYSGEELVALFKEMARMIKRAILLCAALATVVIVLMAVGEAPSLVTGGWSVRGWYGSVCRLEAGRCPARASRSCQKSTVSSDGKTAGGIHPAGDRVRCLLVGSLDGDVDYFVRNALRNSLHGVHVGVLHVPPDSDCLAGLGHSVVPSRI